MSVASRTDHAPARLADPVLMLINHFGLQVLVTSSGRMRSYIAYAIKLLTVRLHGLY